MKIFSIPRRKPVFSPLMRLLWAIVLVLPVFGAKGGVLLTTLYTFGTSTNGANPSAALMQGSDGYFYGTTENGGAHTNAYNTSFGTLFEISTNGSLASLYSFTGGNDGGNPAAALVQGSDGYFYGTTENWGANQSGTIFKIDTNGSLTTLYSFPNLYSSAGTNGANPAAALVEGGDGNFYGTTTAGGDLRLTDWPMGYGTPGLGTVFEISTKGALTNLHAFGLNDGGVPSGLIQGSDGSFYGTTSGGGALGSVFQISSNGTFTNLYSFPYGGGNPPAALVQGSDGYFYGTTEYWGTNNAGTVFKIATNGSLTTLYSFTGGNDGGNPTAALVQGSDGDFYGTTSAGGDANVNPSGYGTVFKISTNGALTTLYSFTGLDDGGAPNGLIQGSDGSFYGTTANTGAGGAGAGIVFRLTIVPEFEAAIVTSNKLNLTWSTEVGGRYQLQYNSELTSSNWINLNSPVTATGATLSTTDSITNAPQRFYRLVLSP
ncbi:MAG TPA: choice-of-anchor tandem repeat GloVer-containing protein [Verrucomicrobiae bacterium]|jgi:uncharacterized repeat protein (TIGR03803 family)|nr:choice-of-anchor tandem repeat GloVer-containing protein [Verrucomicrobiae bacterium]